MDSILRDPRHGDVTTLRISTLARRSFPGWSMAYSGPSEYLAGRIAPLVGVETSDDDARVTRLITMMTGLDLAQKTDG